MLKIIKILIFCIVVLLVFNKQIIKHTLLYAFSKWVDREITVEKFEINYNQGSMIINNAKIINPSEFYYDNLVEIQKVILGYNFKSLFTDVIIINNLTIENPSFFLELIDKPSVKLSPEKTQKIYSDNVGGAKKIVKSTPKKIWPKKDKDINFLILKVKINGAEALIKTPLSPEATKIELSDINYSKIGNAWQLGSYWHHKDALKKIYYDMLQSLSDLELKNFLMDIYGPVFIPD